MPILGSGFKGGGGAHPARAPYFGQYLDFFNVWFSAPEAPPKIVK